MPFLACFAGGLGSEAGFQSLGDDGKEPFQKRLWQRLWARSLADPWRLWWLQFPGPSVPAGAEQLAQHLCASVVQGLEAQEEIQGHFFQLLVVLFVFQPSKDENC